MATETKGHFWRKFRIRFRWFRVTVLLLILLLVGPAFYLNRRGLPQFMTRPVLNALRAQGVDLELRRLRLRFYRGFVATDVRFGRAERSDSPRLSVKEVEVKLNYGALLRRQIRVESLGIRSGKLEWPVGDTNQPSQPFIVENIRANLSFLSDDKWEVDDLEAGFAGLKVTLSGIVKNASAIQRWSFLHARQPVPAATGKIRLQQVADMLGKIHFAARSELRIVAGGDARDLRSFAMRLTLKIPEATTPWAGISHGILIAQLFPMTSNELAHADVNMQAAEARTSWASAKELNLAARSRLVVGQTNIADCDLALQAAQIGSRWANATNVQFTARWLHSLTNPIPLSGHGELRAATAISRWGNGKDFNLIATLAPASNPPPADASWAWWAKLQPCHLDCECKLTELRSEKLVAEEIFVAGQWRPPSLTFPKLHAGFSDGALDARAQLDVPTRDLNFTLVSGFDLHKVSPLLTEKSRHWLSKFSWTTPPKLSGSGSLMLPAWTNRQPDWRGEVQPTVHLSGELAVTNGAYLGLPADWAHSHVTYSNMIWHLPDLEVRRPEGELQLVHTANDRTHDYSWRVHSTIDVHALRPLLGTNEQRGLDLVTFTRPPVIDGEVWGRWYDYDRIGFQAHVAVSNFLFRGQIADHFESMARYTNRFLELFEPRLQRGAQFVKAAGIAADFLTQRIYFTNGFSTAEPLAVARAIGPKTGRTMESYRFTQPPTVRVEGFAPLRGSNDADLRFEVDGGPFKWWKFRVPHISGNVRWFGKTLLLTNVSAAFYDGGAGGFAFFDFRVEKGTDFQFAVGVTNLDLHSLMADVSTRTNHLEGRIKGRLVITNANSADRCSWNGKGAVQLRDGLIWEIPIFGVLSPVLDSILPGLGSSRASEGTAKFVITNGVIYSDTLEIRSLLFRLQYVGTVNMDQRVNARVEAGLLRDTMGGGPDSSASHSGP